MTIDASAQMLQLIANPVRKTIILALEGASMSFTEVMRASGLDPNFDTGPFTYHLSALLDSRIVEKVDNKYRLTNFGNTIATLMKSLERESAFLLKIDQANKGGERMIGKIELKWLGPVDLDGQYGLIMHGEPIEPAPWEKEKRPEDEVFSRWERTLPEPDMPAPSFIGISGHVPRVLIEAIKTNEFDIVLVPLNILTREASEELLPLAKELDVGVVVMKPFGGIKYSFV